ncbi:hypothetical protein ACSMXN_14090 [Jatrophihabitans sp. DSM 45814]
MADLAAVPPTPERVRQDVYNYLMLIAGQGNYLGQVASGIAQHGLDITAIATSESRAAVRAILDEMDEQTRGEEADIGGPDPGLIERCSQALRRGYLNPYLAAEVIGTLELCRDFAELVSGAASIRGGAEGRQMRGLADSVRYRLQTSA